MINQLKSKNEIFKLEYKLHSLTEEEIKIVEENIIIIKNE